MDIKSHITGDLHLTGSSVTRLVRFSETDNQYNGGFFGLKGQTNQIVVGVHNAGDQDAANDLNVITINRSNGYLGINTPTPTSPLHVTGQIKSEGISINPTYTDLPNRLSLVNPSFGGSRLGDSNFQSPSIDTETLYFKGDTQETQAAIFMNTDGSVLTVKGFDDGIMVVDFTSEEFAIGTESGESTIANSIGDSVTGGRYINDQGVQHYHTNGSIVAQSSFQVLQNIGGLGRLKHWVGRYDGTTYDRTYQINTDNTINFDHKIFFDDDVDISGNAHVTGDSSFDGNSDILGNLSVNGSAQIFGKATIEGGANLTFLPIYADDAAASSLFQGDLYQTMTGELRIKL